MNLSSIWVLVADDAPDTVQQICALLALRGFTKSVGCGDGATAIRILRERGPFDVLMTDINMPGTTGFDVLACFRELDREKWPPPSAVKERVALVLTGYGSEEDRKRFLAAGANRVFVRPVDIDQMISFLQSNADPQS